MCENDRFLHSHWQMSPSGLVGRRLTPCEQRVEDIVRFHGQFQQEFTWYRVLIWHEERQEDRIGPSLRNSVANQKRKFILKLSTYATLLSDFTSFKFPLTQTLYEKRMLELFCEEILKKPCKYSLSHANTVDSLF